MILELTKKRLLKIWWAIFWRQVVFSFVVGIVVGLPLGYILPQFGFDNEQIEIIGNLIGLPIMLLACAFALYLVLKKDFKEFRIKLIKQNIE